MNATWKLLKSCKEEANVCPIHYFSHRLNSVAISLPATVQHHGNQNASQRLHNLI